MALACTRCGSHMLTEDYDIARPNERGYRCAMCGRDELMEEDTMGTKKCERDGCERFALKDGLCATHFREKHGVPVRAMVKVAYRRRGRKAVRIWPAQEGDTANNPALLPVELTYEIADGDGRKARITVAVNGDEGMAFQHCRMTDDQGQLRHVSYEELAFSHRVFEAIGTILSDCREV